MRVSSMELLVAILAKVFDWAFRKRAHRAGPSPVRHPPMGRVWRWIHEAFEP